MILEAFWEITYSLLSAFDLDPPPPHHHYHFLP